VSAGGRWTEVLGCRGCLHLAIGQVGRGQLQARMALHGWIMDAEAGSTFFCACADTTPRFRASALARPCQRNESLLARIADQRGG
jgi:hypothetical protein